MATQENPYKVIGMDIRTAQRMIRKACAAERERCCAIIREHCAACGGSGIGEVTFGVVPDVNPADPDGEPIAVPVTEATECEYCGRPIAAIRALPDEET